MDDYGNGVKVALLEQRKEPGGGRRERYQRLLCQREIIHQKDTKP